MPGCPWDALAPANLEFCEADVCGWVTQPANTWSNAGFFAAAAWIAWAARRDGRPIAGLLAPIAAGTGLGSIALHATSSLAGQLVDQSAMLLESAFFVVATLRVLSPLGRTRALALYAALALGPAAAMVAFPTTGIALFAGEILAFAALELALLRRAPRISYRPLAAVALLFAVSYAAWWLDHLRIACDPENHVFGLHALWHLLGAASFPAWYAHFAQRERAAVAPRGPQVRSPPSRRAT